MARKRKADQDASSSDESWETEISSEDQYSDDEIDISASLTGQKSRKRTKISTKKEGSKLGDDEDIREMIHEFTNMRNVKDGTDVVKKTKGKTKVAKGEVGGGSFQSMGLHPSLLRSLTLQGFRIPTPIQRLSIPALLENPPRDLVGMARTGSGKSLAYLVPLVHRLGGRHSTTFGARALILLPTRELALQILKVGKELARGFHGQGEHAGDSSKMEDGRKTRNIRWSLIVGGEGLDDQFEMITSNPDVIIATPGRLLHLIVEMNLDLKSVQYVVFDEADRLFEMGFETALTEILQRLPASRQTLLFSATLPKSLVEFAQAGLQDPKLVRLDAESKISSDLRMAFFSVKQAEKDACLLALLRDVIKVPIGSPQSEKLEGQSEKSKGADKGKAREQTAAPHQTLVFAATKHHVEYLTTLLTTVGYDVSHIYGSLDQAARTHQMDRFRRGITSVLVVTDVAARGIDIPVLKNVVNYDFPQGPRVFVHRVGRTARAGRQGWAWSFVTNTDLPYLLDLQLFLGRPLKSDVSGDDSDAPYVESLVLGTFLREQLDEDMEFLRSLDEVNHSLPSLREVMKRGHAMYERSKFKASPPSYQRAKSMIKDPTWLLAGADSGVHPVLLRGSAGVRRRDYEEKRKTLLRAVGAFRPSETVFEVGSKGNTETAALMKQRRKALSRAVERAVVSASISATLESEGESDKMKEGDADMELADEEQIAAVFNVTKKGPKNGPQSFRDPEFYMSHYQKDAATEKGYSLASGSSTFVEQARSATFDLAGDEAVQERKRRQLSWDKKKRKFVRGDGVGADNMKLVRTENGTRLPASYRSGRFDEWKAKSHISLPRVGEAEPEKPRNVGGQRSKMFKHNASMPAKPLDKLHKDYDRKLRQMKKTETPDEKDAGPSKAGHSKGRKGRSGARFAGKSIGRVKNELKNAEQIRKQRNVTEKKRAKNARPSRKKGR